MNKNLLLLTTLSAFSALAADNFTTSARIISSDECRDRFGFYTTYHIDSAILPLEITLINESDTRYIACAHSCIQHKALFSYSLLTWKLRKQQAKDVFFNLRYDILRRYSSKPMPERDNDASMHSIKRLLNSSGAFLQEKNHYVEPGSTTYIVFLDKNILMSLADQPILITLEDADDSQEKIVVQVGIPREIE